MRALDLSPLYGSMIGAERLAGALESAFRTPEESSYPPYDIEKLGEDEYRICFAVAGFRPDELQVLAESNQLTVSGRKANPDPSRDYLHRGIATRAFERRFELADYVVVSGAEYGDGMLTISLKRELPEAMKPRRIEIRSPEAAVPTPPQADAKASADRATAANDPGRTKPKRTGRKAA